MFLCIDKRFVLYYITVCRTKRDTNELEKNYYS